jgi:hypothetical protein
MSSPPLPAQCAADLDGAEPARRITGLPIPVLLLTGSALLAFSTTLSNPFQNSVVAWTYSPDWFYVRAVIELLGWLLIAAAAAQAAGSIVGASNEWASRKGLLILALACVVASLVSAIDAWIAFVTSEHSGFSTIRPYIDLTRASYVVPAVACSLAVAGCVVSCRRLRASDEQAAWTMAWRMTSIGALILTLGSIALAYIVVFDYQTALVIGPNVALCAQAIGWPLVGVSLLYFLRARREEGNQPKSWPLVVGAIACLCFALHLVVFLLEINASGARGKFTLFQWEFAPTMAAWVLVALAAALELRLHAGPNVDGRAMRSEIPTVASLMGPNSDVSQADLPK